MDLSEQTMDLDAVALSAMVHAGEVQPLELLDAVLARVDRLNPKINAVVERMDDLARRQAVDCATDGPLAGVPIFMKALMTICLKQSVLKQF